VILSRVDGLDSDVKDTLQVASVVGDSFPPTLLERVMESDNLSSSLRALERAQMLQRWRTGDHWEYRFRHPLIQRSFWVRVNEVTVYRNQARYEDIIDFCRKELAGPPVEQAEERRIANFQGALKDARLMMGKLSWDDALAMELELRNLYIRKSRALTGSYAEIGKLYLDMGEWEKAITECETALSMSPSPLWAKISTILLGRAYCKTGQLDKGIALLERWKAYNQSVGRGDLTLCEYSLPLAEGYLAQGDIGKARVNADEALRIAGQKGLPLHEAQAYRILGEIIAQTDFPSAADHFSRSLEIMQRIKARNEEGITELSWGRACQQHGDMGQARAQLTRAAEIFEELDTTRYLEWTQEAITALGKE
jgi:tetratricopeptide (TPR) repeat protein